MSATADDVAATTAVIPAPDGDTETPQGADSAPAVNDSDEDTRKAIAPVQDRINELTRKRYDAERERDYWRNLAANPQPRAEPEPAPQETGKTLADFGFDEAKFQKYLFGEARKEAVKAAREELAAEQQRTETAKRRQSFGAREAKFAKGVPDYYEVAHYAQITNEMAEAIMSSDLGAELAYHLGKNEDIAAQIRQLPPLQQAREIGRLEAKLSATPKPPQVSGAPPPAPKIAAANASVEKDPKDMTDAEFAKWRRKQIAQRH